MLLSLAALGTVALPVSAALTDVPSGGTVFIGEQGLNIAATNVTAGSQMPASEPAATSRRTPPRTS